ncbi:hypothetical protein PLEOSDRAFT_170569 [Pleurotus ostreatus PC15]|uniref:Uncharacterized protein n=1 Tax=Pleurotus ostreatus (strain PC15) TaxID=1137138 RepID=A0A067NJT7_PLEO1|nr:hypothetical protein PLEOSDRAFT_170569 [Pleurotus ostreatus PC15]
MSSNLDPVNPAFLVDNKFLLAATHEECVKNVVALAKSMPKQQDRKGQEWEKWFRCMDQSISIPGAELDPFNLQKEVMFVGGRAKELGCFGWIEESLVKTYKEAVILYYREQGQPVVVKASTQDSQKPRDGLFTPTPEKILRKPIRQNADSAIPTTRYRLMVRSLCGARGTGFGPALGAVHDARNQGRACARKHIRCSHTKHLVNPTTQSSAMKHQGSDDDSSDIAEDSSQEYQLEDSPPPPSKIPAAKSGGSLVKWMPLSSQNKGNGSKRLRPSDSSRSSSPNTRSKKRMVHETSVIISSDSEVDEPTSSALKKRANKPSNSISPSRYVDETSGFHDKFSRLRKANAEAHKLTMRMLANTLEISEALIDAQIPTTKGNAGSQVSRRK